MPSRRGSPAQGEVPARPNGALLESAQSRSQNDAGQTSHQFSAYAGRLLETYAVELTESVHPGQRTAGGGRVFGEQAYGTGGQKRTSDLLVDLGQDIVLVEISASRLRADTLILGDTKNVEKDLNRMLISKIRQLDGCVSALTAGAAKFPDVDLNQVLRIWPIVVTAGKIVQTAPLWEYLDRHAGQCLKQPRVQPLTLLDIEDYEHLLAIVEQGHAMHELLAKKCSPEFRRFELRVWLAYDPRAPHAIELPRMLANALEERMTLIPSAAEFDPDPSSPEGLV